MTSHPCKYVLSLGVLAFVGCGIVFDSACHAADPVAVEGMEFFEEHVRPVLAKWCYSCHSEREQNREGDLVLDSRAGWLEGGSTGAAVIPGDVDGSLLIRAVRYDDPNLQMPPDKPLSPQAIARLSQWVKMGAPDPRSGATIPQSHDRPAEVIARKPHWAYQPLKAAQPPEVEASDWPRSTIDSFVLARLQENQLRPAPDANPRTLARRVYFQLIGIPPTTEQLNEFLDDDRPEAFERLVDQLLNSPHFGERWGRHWLDLARYADSNGLDENFLFREAWRYRNWVINTVNADVPFDRFLLEQMAGDLLPYDSIEQRDQQRIGAGFMVIGPKVLLGNDPDNQRMEVADELIDTIGKAVLGQTLGCARCHDHKFDPFPTADYYALAGILTSTQVVERRYMLNQQRVMERLVGLGPDGDSLDDAYERYWRERPKLTQRLQQAKSALKLLKNEKWKGFQEYLGKHADAVAAVAADSQQPIKTRLAAQDSLIAKLDAVIKSPAKIPPRAMIPSDVEQPADEHVRLAGQFDRLGDQVPRGFLQVLDSGDMRIPDETSGRLELAQWITDLEGGAGHLAARVLVNRLWHHLIGRGIVRTVDNFGRTGEAPTHPELLDHLAAELIESGWSLKHVIREIVLSRTFSISSLHDDDCHAIDPENRLVWRANRRRLDPESLRDAMLLVAGELDLRPMGSTVSYLGDQATSVGNNKNRRRTDFPCRSVYLPVIRNDLPELFDVFNFADPHATTGMRSQTLVATQRLFVLNDESVMDAAEATAKRSLASGAQPEEVIDHLFELIFGAPASEQERTELLSFTQAIQRQLSAHDDSMLRAWTMTCHALFASSRFQVVE